MIERKIYEPGIYTISNDDYHSSAGISRSGIMLFKKSPKHFWNKYINEKYVAKEQSSEMIFGSAVHCYILEPKKFYEEYYISKNFDKRTTIGKQKYAEMLIESQGKILIEQCDVDEIKLLSDSIKNDPLAYELISAAKYEKSIFWIDEETELLCKCRPDIMHDNFIVDLKTTKDASQRSFQRSFFEYGYYLQMGMINQGIKHLTGKNITSFIDLAIEKEEPYATAIYIIDEDTLNFGIDEFHYYLNKIKQCIETNIWNSYNTNVISLPSYIKVGE